MDMQHKLIANLDELLPHSSNIASVAAQKIPGEYALYCSAYLKAAWKLALTKRRTPFFILSYIDEKLVAVAPLQLFVMGPKRLYCKQIEFFNSQSNPLCYAHSRFLVAQSIDEYEYLTCIQSYLNAQTTIPWDQLMLSGVFANEIPPFEYTLNCTEKAEISSTYAADLSQGFDAYFMNAISSKSRTKIRKHIKTLASKHSYTTKKYHNSSEELIQKFITIHTERQSLLRSQGRGERKSIFDETHTKAIFIEFINELANQQALHIETLEIHNEPVAFIICVGSKDTIHAILMSYKSEFNSFSPLKVLALAAIDRAGNKENSVSFSFGQDKNTFKEQLGKAIKRRYKLRGTCRESFISKNKYFICKRLDSFNN